LIYIYRFDSEITQKLISVKDKKGQYFYDCYDFYIPAYDPSNFDELLNLLERSRSLIEVDLEKLKMRQIIQKSKSFKSLLQNFKEKEESKILSKILENKIQYPEIVSQIEFFFEKQLHKNEKLIVEYLEMKIGNEIEFLLYFLFDILIKHLEAKKGLKMVQKVLFAQMNDQRGRGFLHSLFPWPENNDEKLTGNIFEKLKEIKKHFPETIFKQLFLLKEKSSSFTFLICIANAKTFKFALNFIKSEFGDEFLKEILFSEDLDGDCLFNMTYIINRSISVLEHFKFNFDKTFIKQFLMHKNNFQQNFLICDFQGRYSDPANSDDLIKLFYSIFSIFNKDFELFNDLFKSKDKFGACFIKKLQAKYEDEKLEKLKIWLKENLGEDYLNSLDFK
jgi:hypothetical protein